MPIPTKISESFWLSSGADYDWFDRSSVFYRKESVKGNSNGSNFNSNYPKFGVRLKAKASIIGFPNSWRSNSVISRKRVAKSCKIRLFPKRYASSRKSLRAPEPGSPKVSCIGKVRSRRVRRKNKIGENSVKNSGVEVKEGKGFYFRVTNMFRRKKAQVVEVSIPAPTPQEIRFKEIAVTCEPPKLGSVKRFSARRRSEILFIDES